MSSRGIDCVGTQYDKIVSGFLSVGFLGSLFLQVYLVRRPTKETYETDLLTNR